MSLEEITCARDVDTTHLDPTATFGTPPRFDGDNAATLVACQTAESAYVTRSGNRKLRWAYTVFPGQERASINELVSDVAGVGSRHVPTSGANNHSEFFCFAHQTHRTAAHTGWSLIAAPTAFATRIREKTPGYRGDSAALSNNSTYTPLWVP